MSSRTENTSNEPSRLVEPEYPPQYGNDGVELIEQGILADMEAKVAFDTPNKGTTDPAILQLERRREEQIERVTRRRNPTNPFLKAMNFVVPYGGIVSSAFNLASSTLGAGIIALPVAFQTSGIGMGIIYLVVVATMVVYSFNLLTIVGHRTGIYSYEKITRVLLGRGADYLLAVLMWLLCFGGDVSYVISMMSIIKGFVNNSASAPDYLKTTSGSRLLTSLVWLVAMLPLCLPKEINSLRVMSTIAVLFIVYFVIIIVIHSCTHGLKHGVRDDLVYFQSGNRAIQGLSLFLFSYVNQVNAYEVLDEMHKPTTRRMTLSAFWGTLLCFVLYFMAGLFGYMDFGSAVTDSILDLYNPIEDPAVGVAYAGIILKLCVGYGLHMIPCRDALYHIIGLDVKTLVWWKNCIYCTILAVCSLLAGLFIPRITTVFGLLGSLCGGSIGYVFPALMFMYSGNFTVKSVGWGHYLGTHVLLLAGVIAIVFGTTASIYGEIMSNR